jgi:hypothetical protein
MIFMAGSSLRLRTLSEVGMKSDEKVRASKIGDVGYKARYACMYFIICFEEASVHEQSRMRCGSLLVLRVSDGGAG